MPHLCAGCAVRFSQPAGGAPEIRGFCIRTWERGWRRQRGSTYAPAANNSTYEYTGIRVYEYMSIPSSTLHHHLAYLSLYIYIYIYIYICGPPLLAPPAKSLPAGCSKSIPGTL